MDYDLFRTNAIRNNYLQLRNTALRHFVPGRKTVVLLPGGMGSQLERSAKPYTEFSPVSNDYETVWMDIGILLNGDGLRLEIDPAGRDIGGHIIIPNGPLRFLIDAYDGTASFFNDTKNGEYNYFVFGYDWRRPIEEAAAFLHEFLRMFRDAVLVRDQVNPLADLTLLSHSQGGLVAKMFIERVPNPLDWFEQVITVATPFYGTTTHQPRYYIGQSPLSQLHSARVVAKIVASLPGPYTLMPLDLDTFQQYHQDIGLDVDGYPVVDSQDGTPADPYSANSLNRYPEWVNARMLDQARQIRQVIARPMREEVARHVFNIRSVKDKKTPTRQGWDPKPPADDESPIHTISKHGGGDGTVPYWSSWHASTPTANRIQLKKAKDHPTLVENEETLRIVKHIVDTGSALDAPIGANRLYGEKVKPVDLEALDGFIEDVRSGRSNRADPRMYDPRYLQRLYQEMKR